MEAAGCVTDASKAQVLRGIVAERLTAAAQDILAAVERTVADYEAEVSGLREEIERQRRHLELLHPLIKQETIDDQFPVCEPGGRAGQEVAEQGEQHKHESDLLPVCEPAEEEQRRRQQSVEGSNISSEAQREEDEDEEEEEEEPLTEEEYQASSSSPAPSVQSDRRSSRGPGVSGSEDHIELCVCILEDPQIIALSDDVSEKYPVLEVRCPRGLQEADFLQLLRSMFPQLATQKPFDFLKANRFKTLEPLRVMPLTPEEIFIHLVDHSALYIRLKTQEELNSADEQFSSPQRSSADVPSSPNPTRSLLPSDTPGRCRSTASRNDIVLRLCILDSQIKVLSVGALENYPLQELRCPRGLQEADFLHLLRSNFPKLANREPFDVFTPNKCKVLEPLSIKTLTPEEICSQAMNGSIYIRLKPQEESKSKHEEIQPSKSSNTFISLRFCFLENQQVDPTSPKIELRCPFGMQEVDFVQLLRSKFPQLAPRKTFDFFTMDRTRRLWPFRVERLTPEEIYRKTKFSVIYIRLKPPEEIQTRKKEPLQTKHAATDPLSRDKIRLRTRATSSGKPRLSEPQNHVDLRICFLEDSSIDRLSVSVYQKYGVWDVRYPCGLQEADFLLLLRSRFPQLGDQEPFDLFKTGKMKTLLPLDVPTLTPEEINKSISSTGQSALYIRRKPQETGETGETGRPRVKKLKKRRFLAEYPRMSTRAQKSEEISRVVCETLPDLSEDTRLQIVSKLQSAGLESKVDLQHIQEEVFGDLLPAVQLQKLLAAFKSASETDALNLQRISPRTSAKQRRRQTWGETFQVPWKQMPQEVCTAIAMGKKPTPSGRRQMVRILVDEMMKYEENPNPRDCCTVVRYIVREYPKSFADDSPDGSLLGFKSLLLQVRNRVGNCQRIKKRTTASRSGSAFKRESDGRRSSLQPELPPQEADDPMEWSRQRLEDIYRQQGAGGGAGPEVVDLMALTFELQRRHIGAVPPPRIRDLKHQWPFLFTQRFLCSHFERLTGVDALRCLEVAMEDGGGEIMEYFRGEPTNRDVEEVLATAGNGEVALCVVRLLMAHFAEEPSGLLLHADASDAAADVELNLALPASPRLILLEGAEKVAVRRWMVSCEGRVVCEGDSPSCLAGLATMFAIYYIFNLKYQDEAASTLQFIQRSFVGMNGETSRGEDVSTESELLHALNGTSSSNPVLPEMKKEEADDEDGGRSGSLGVAPDNGGKPSVLKRDKREKSPAKRRRRENGDLVRSDGPLRCKVCKTRRGSTKLMIKHAWSHLDQSEKLCGMCGEHLESAEALKSHLQGHQKTFSCNMCGKSFVSVGGLKGHIARHKGQLPYGCRVCKRWFLLPSLLKKHMNTHRTSKPPNCDSVDVDSETSQVALL